MYSLLTAIVQYCQTTFPTFVGGYYPENVLELGPFLNIAPEAYGDNDNEDDYMTYQVFGTPSDLGFINGAGSTTYTEKPRIRFMTWSVNPDRAMQNMETFTATMDTLTSLSLGGGEACFSIVRFQNAQNIPQPKSKNAGQTWMFFVDYEFRNVRILGATGVT